MIREPVAGPRAWTRASLREEDWRLPLPDACAAEIEGLTRPLERDPVPLHLLDPDDYALDACRALVGEVRRRLADGPGWWSWIGYRSRSSMVAGRASRQWFWLLGGMVGRPVVQTRDGEIMVEVTDTG